jgi:hypothetical protein
VEGRIEIQNDEDWRCLLSFLPENWEQMAADSGALLRLRGFDDASCLLRTLLIHFLEGFSLRQTVVAARQMGIADISDVALLKRLNSSGEWFRQMASSLVLKMVEEKSWEILPKGYDIQMVDATCISKPGSQGTNWRVHYGIDLPTLRCRTLLVTDESVGETLQNFEISPKTLLIGDRGYSNRPGIAHVVKNGGDVLIRMNLANLPLRTAKDQEFDLLKHLRRLSTRKVGEWDAHFTFETTYVEGRVCALKKSRIAAELARDKIMKAASKKQKVPKPETVEAAGYIYVFTTLPSSEIVARDVLEIYRGRWQIELAFKRLKSLLELGALPKKDPPGAKSWIYGKLFAALLIEALITNPERFSPWGYNIGQAS